MGKKREIFRAEIEEQLISYGYEADSWVWQQNPARFVIAVGGKFRTLQIKATMKREKLAYELGRLKGWAEMLGLDNPKNGSAEKYARGRQLDIEGAIAGAA